MKIWSKRESSADAMISQKSSSSSNSSKRLPSALRKKQSRSSLSGASSSRVSLDALGAFDASFHEFDWKSGDTMNLPMDMGRHSSVINHRVSSNVEQSRKHVKSQEQGVSFASNTRIKVNPLDEVYSIPQNLPQRLLNNRTEQSNSQSPAYINNRTQRIESYHVVSGEEAKHCSSNPISPSVRTKIAPEVTSEILKPPLRTVSITEKPRRRHRKQSQVVSDAQLIQVLLNMGYNEVQCHRALSALRGDSDSNNACSDDSGSTDTIESPKIVSIKELSSNNTLHPCSTSLHVNNPAAPSNTIHKKARVDFTLPTFNLPACSNDIFVKSTDDKTNDIEDKTHPKMEVLLEDLKARLSSAINAQTISKPSDNTSSNYKYSTSIIDENELKLTESKFDSDSTTKDFLEQTPDLVEHSEVIEKEKVREAMDVSVEVSLELAPKKAIKIPEENLPVSDIYEMLELFASCNLAGLCYSSENPLNCGSAKNSEFIPPREINTPLNDTDSIGELTQLTWEYDVEKRTSLRKSNANNSNTEPDSVVIDESSYAELTLGDETVNSILRAKETLRKYASHLGVNTLLNGDEEATIATMVTKDTNTQAETLDDKDYDHSIGSDTKASILKAQDTLKSHALRVGEGIVENDIVSIRDIDSCDESGNERKEDTMINYLLDSYEFCTGYDAPSRKQLRVKSIDDETLG